MQAHSKSTSYKALLLFMLIALTFVITSCSSNKDSATGALKRTQYCEYYREFDEKVATADAKTQKKLLEKILKAKDFPSEPASLRADYEKIIEGYKKVEDGTYKVKNQESYKKASERINRHAIDNCELFKSNSGASI